MQEDPDVATLELDSESRRSCPFGTLAAFFASGFAG